MTSRTLNVPEISCGHCKSAIEAAVSPLDGVDNVEVQIEERTVHLDYDGTDATLNTIVTAIEDVGYEVPDQA
ncbi:MAG: copper ion binding protein [Acidimicrobiia bacterium]|jgi:copper chaperone